MLLTRLSLILIFIFYGITFTHVYAAEYSFAQQYKNTFTHFIDTSLTGKGRESFEAMVKEVENNIQWHDQKTKNKYLDAYERSLPFMRKLGRDDVPKMVFLIPYLESTWQGEKGNPASDYGYWQMVPEVINEIRQLDEASDRLMQADANTARADVELSTEAALIHLYRYYFYFRHVAGFAEEDAWLFSMTAFNWGAGNIKATIATMKKKEKRVTFSSFYHYLYTLNKMKKSKGKTEARSSRVALEYLPNLWNIVLLIQQKNKLAKK
jgi:uncharacterized damage-inducible protein DinB